MKLKDLKNYHLADVSNARKKLNPNLWDEKENLVPEIRTKLLKISENFQEFVGIGDREISDIVISGSNASYNYVAESEIDIHLIVNSEKYSGSEVYKELVNENRRQYNENSKFSCNGHNVELYIHDENVECISQGIYSILHEKWVSVPTKRHLGYDDISTISKLEDLKEQIKSATKSKNAKKIKNLWERIGRFKQFNKSRYGKSSPEFLTYKILSEFKLANKLERIVENIKKKESKLQEEKNREYIEEHIDDFIKFCVKWLDLKTIPKIDTVHGKKWSVDNGTFGQYNARNDHITVSIAGRHPVDAMRTIAHELVHYSQNENGNLPPSAGETGSPWENDANATAGQIMRDYVDVNPDIFSKQLKEASGYIPTNKKEANDPRYSHGLTVDIKPGEIQRQAAKLGLTTGPAGVPPLLGKKKNNKKKSNLKENLRVDVPNDEWLNNKIRKAKEKGRDNYGVPYTGTITAYFPDTVKLPVDLLKRLPGMRGEQKNVRREDLEKIMQVMKDTGKLPLTAFGREYAPFVQVAWNGEAWVNEGNHRIMAADALGWKYLPVELRYYDGGERVESGALYPQKLGLNESYSQNADNEELLEVEMSPSALQNWAKSEGSEGIRAGFEAEIILPISKSLERDLDNDRIPDSIEEVLDFFGGPHMSQDDMVRFEDKLVGDYIDWARKKLNFPDDYDEDDLIDLIDEKITYEQWFNDKSIFLSDIADMYAGIINWPDYIQHTGFIPFSESLEDVLGRSVYSGSRDSDEDSYTIVPDESIATEMNDDEGMEIVSPPLPLQEMLDDLSKLKEFLDEEGAETNTSTGLHINISIPESKKVDYVKLALFSGDEYILEQFDRLFNQYAMNALKKIQNNVLKKRTGIFDPTDLFETLREGSIEIASRILQQEVGEEKYTSIHIQRGYIEFRAPGGDWLSKDIDTLTNTTLRYARAMSIAGDPEAEKREYLKKLYKLIDKGNPVQNLFVQYAAGEINKDELLKKWATKVLNSDKLSAVGPGETIEYYKVSSGEDSVIVRAKNSENAELQALASGLDMSTEISVEQIDDGDIPKELAAQKRRDNIAKRIRQRVTIFLFGLSKPDGEYRIYINADSEHAARKRAKNHPLITSSKEQTDNMKLVDSFSGTQVKNPEQYDFKHYRKTVKLKLKISLETDGNRKEFVTQPLEIEAESIPRARKKVDELLSRKVREKYGDSARIEEVDFANSMGQFKI